jgi:hypothetical protein
MDVFTFSRRKLILSIASIIISIIVFVYLKFICKTGRVCSGIMPEQWPFAILAILFFLYITLMLLNKKK